MMVAVDSAYIPQKPGEAFPEWPFRHSFRDPLISNESLSNEFFCLLGELFALRFALVPGQRAQFVFNNNHGLACGVHLAHYFNCIQTFAECFTNPSALWW